MNDTEQMRKLMEAVSPSKKKINEGILDSIVSKFSPEKAEKLKMAAVVAKNVLATMKTDPGLVKDVAKMDLALRSYMRSPDSKKLYEQMSNMPDVVVARVVDFGAHQLEAEPAKREFWGAMAFVAYQIMVERGMIEEEHFDFGNEEPEEDDSNQIDNWL